MAWLGVSPSATPPGVSTVPSTPTTPGGTDSVGSGGSLPGGTPDLHGTLFVSNSSGDSSSGSAALGSSGSGSAGTPSFTPAQVGLFDNPVNESFVFLAGGAVFAGDSSGPDNIRPALSESHASLAGTLFGIDDLGPALWDGTHLGDATDGFVSDASFGHGAAGEGWPSGLASLFADLHDWFVL